jgi:hypothetical protein
MNLFPLIAEAIERDPSVIERAVETLRHWEASGAVPAARIAQWNDLLGEARRSPEGMTELLRLLREDSAEARRIKDFAPFAGILSREQRRPVFLSCSYDH